MKKFIKSKAFILSFLAVVVLVATIQLTAVAVQNKYKDTQLTDTKPVSSLRIQVVNLRGAPLANAKVTIVESGKTYSTDLKGYTPVMQVTFQETALTKTVDGNFSFVTVVVTRDGYVDYILYNCLIYKERMRSGPVITLFNTGESSAKYISTVEVPPDEWTQEFLNKIKQNYSAVKQDD